MDLLEKKRELHQRLSNFVAMNGTCIALLKSDGTVIVDGDSCGSVIGNLQEADQWNDIVAIKGGVENHTTFVGLKSDGTVVAVGRDYKGQCQVGNWRNISTIETNAAVTVGIRSDGCVEFAGDTRCGMDRVREWNNIKALAVGVGHILGLKENGRAVAVGFDETTSPACIQYGDGSVRCAVSHWRNIKFITTDCYQSVGITANGDVVSTNKAWKEIAQWHNIVSVVCRNGYCIVGLKEDGTVVMDHNNNDIGYDTSKWRDIVGISIGYRHIVGVKSDGSCVAIGDNCDGQCDVSSWTNVVCIYAYNNSTVGIRSDGSVLITGF